MSDAVPRLSQKVVSDETKGRISTSMKSFWAKKKRKANRRRNGRLHIVEQTSYVVRYGNGSKKKEFGPFDSRKNAEAFVSGYRKATRKK